jgi:hypothetical protein
MSEHSPTKLRRSNRTTTGAIIGKMRENVEANMIARTQALTANVGL